VQYANPALYPPIHHLRALFARRGWSIRSIGIAPDRREGAIALRDDTIDLMYDVAPQEPGWRQKLAFAQFCVRAIALALRGEVSLIYASDVFATPAALAMSLIVSKPIIYHEHDWPAWTGDEKRSPIVRILLAARRQLGRRAAICVFPSAGRRDAFASIARPVHTVVARNMPRLMTPELSSNRPSGTPPRCEIIYHGSISPLKVPLTLLRALTRVPELALRIVGYETHGTVGYIESLRAEAKELGISNRVHLMPPVPHEELAAERERAVLGWGVIPMADTDGENLRSMIGASCKIYEYMSASVVPIVASTAAWEKEFVEPGYALACQTDVDDIVRVLAWSIKNRPEIQRMGERAAERIRSEWNYDAETAALFTRIEEMICARKGKTRQ
jgi:Glycosyltransferase